MKTKMQFVMNKGKGALAVVLSVLLLNSVMDYSGVVSVRAAAGDASGSAGGVFSESGSASGNGAGAENGQQATLAQMPRLEGTYGQKVEEMTISGGRVTASGDSSVEITGTWSVSDAAKAELPKVGTTTAYELTFTPTGKFADGYDSITCRVVPKVAKKPLTIAINDAEKKYGEENPVLTCDESYADRLVPGDDVSVIRSLQLDTEAMTTSSAGTYPITGSAQSDYYEITFTEGTLTVNKASLSGWAMKGYLYFYGDGAEMATADITAELPADRGDTIYRDPYVSDRMKILDDISLGEDGVITYSVKKLDSSYVGKFASLSAYVEMQNYETVKYELKVKISDQFEIERRSGIRVKVIGSNELTYGETLSKLTLNGTGSTKAVFVEKDTFNEVEGTLSWKDADLTPDTETTKATWLFTPTEQRYKELEGEVTISVVKATPKLNAPVTAQAAYDPGVTLGAGFTLTGGSAFFLKGDTETAVEGTFEWKEPDTVPTVGEKEYAVVFTPTDTQNFETAETLVKVSVTRQTPTVTVAPTVSELTYGQKLSDSTLTGGTASVEGTFAWKDGSIKPAVSDSGVTRYTLIFTPTDTAHYAAAECEVTVSVQKADKIANAPSKLDPVYVDTVGQVVLPTGWVWEESDRSTALTIGTTVTAAANYEGADKGNYEDAALTVTVDITRRVKPDPGTGGSGSGTGGNTTGGGAADNTTEETDDAAAATEQAPAPAMPMPDNTRPAGNRTDTTPDAGEPAEDVQEDSAQSAEEEGSLPFIRDDAGRTGWDAIGETLDEAESGDTVAVDMNESTKVPAAIFEGIQGRDITVILDMGDGITWTVNGKSVTDVSGDIDFGVILGENAGLGIPVDVINNVTGERHSVNLTLAYDGEFGFTAVLTVNMGEKNAGLYANLFYYDSKAGELIFMCADEIGADGSAALKFTHASEYTIVIDSAVMDGTETDSMPVNAGSDTENGDAGTQKAATWIPGWLIAIGGGVILTGIAVILLLRRRKPD